jgi:hypothetical protein
MSIEIITNNQERDIIYYFELNDEERAEFDYCNEFDTFFRYKKETYHLGEFMTVQELREPAFNNWHGYCSDSFFSGMVVRYSEDNEHVIVGTYFS